MADPIQITQSPSGEPLTKEEKAILYGEPQQVATEPAQTTETDIFQQQKKTIETLTDVLEKQGEAQSDVVYVQPQAPAQAAPKNYVLYIVLGIAAYLIFKK